MAPLSSLQRDQASSPLSLLLFRRYIFCSHRERSVVRATSNGLPHLSLFRLPSKRCPLFPSLLVPPVQNRSPREFVDYNKCVCSSRRYRTSSGFLLALLSSFPSSLSALSSPRFSPLPISLSILLSRPISRRRSEEGRDRWDEIIQSNRS